MPRSLEASTVAPQLDDRQVVPRQAPRELSVLPARLARLDQLQRRLADWSSDREIWFAGVRDSVRALTAAMLVEQAQLDVLLVIVPEAVDADIVATDLAAFGIPEADLLPLSGSLGDPASLRDHDLATRLRVLQRLRRATDDPAAGVEPLVVCASVAAAIQAVPSRATVAAAGRQLSVGQVIDLSEWLSWLAGAGFHHTTSVQLPGEFSQRGGIVDIFPPDNSEPVRIELFDEEVESIRHFDPASQRSTGRLTQIELSAVGPTMGERGQLAEYLAASTAVLVVEPEQCGKVAEALRARVADPDRFTPWEPFLSSLAAQRLAFAVDLPGSESSATVTLPTASVAGFSGELERIRQRVDTVAAGHSVVIVADTPADAERMGELLRETDAATHGRLQIAVADLSGGFRISESGGDADSVVGADSVDGDGGTQSTGVLVLTGAELFHRSPVRRVRTRVKGKPIDSFHQLEPGDLVVHLSHGIGLYRGVQQVEKQGQTQEHLVVEFDGETKIYVPAHRIGLIQRYVGGGSSRPRLAKVGGQSWTKKRQAVEQAVHDMASELLEVQAERQTRAGITFEVDSQWQQQFDASFPYTETTDQMSAIMACKFDMETTRPMDRLICGDVGYGKTEVAMRAAFKAVDSGYQVAVLVPTTVLAEQHYHTFCERMIEFPVDIGRLNRFAERSEERDTVAKIRKGQVDIVIGTHRLASKQVEFFNLGLVIIDEEHRFGVAIKERLKAKHSNVDVLTLSATPIPRTLHMALVGARDISNLETPPAERLSVETQVVRWSDSLIRSAIVRELNRGGQVFFVHNRVADIEKLAVKLQRIVPEARIGIGHGQMEEHQLEQVMIDFVRRKYDVLLATTIIENGLDIPNANTIFVDEANRYGLADLHQLRGRVGRYKHQAYCYMLLDRSKYLTPEASKRLRAIEEFSQMGAGFAISMRDLEIRGAGNLLGTQQSGFIAAVGYELYCQLLEDAVRHAQNLPPRVSTQVDIDVPVAAFLPSDYVPDMRHKIDLYRRIARLDQFPAIEEIRGEIVDRFGPLPRAVQRLLELAELRLEAAIWQLHSISLERSFLVLKYSDATRVRQLQKSSSQPVRIVDESKAYVPIGDIESDDDGDTWLRMLGSILRSG